MQPPPRQLNGSWLARKSAQGELGQPQASFDSSEAFSLTAAPLKIEVLLPTGVYRSFVFPKSTTVAEVKEFIWKNVSGLGQMTEHQLAISDVLRLTTERGKLRKAHPLLLQGYREGRVLRLKLIRSDTPLPPDSPTAKSLARTPSWRSATANVITPAAQASAATSAGSGSMRTAANPTSPRDSPLRPLASPRGGLALSSNAPLAAAALADEFAASEPPVDVAGIKHRQSIVMDPAALSAALKPACAIVRVAGYYVDEGMELPLDPFSASNVCVEDPQCDVPYYYEYFYGKEHVNYIGAHDTVGPIVLSIAEKADNLNYRAIIWTKSGDERLFLPEAEVKTGSLRSSSSKQTLRLLKKMQPSIADVRLVPVKHADFQRRLAEMELRQIVTSYKIGVLLAKAGQVKEEDMFSNKDSTPRFDEFLAFLGDRIALRGWPDYRGGLDTKADLTGAHSVYTKWGNYEIMFHVSTLLPYSTADPQQLERKRHIGNDIVVVVFQEDVETPYSPLTISSAFNHVFVVVNPLPPATAGGLPRYRVTVAAKDGVRPWKPLMPSPCVFERTPALREFFLTKLVNAERAAYHARAFGDKITRTRRTVLANLISEFANK